MNLGTPDTDVVYEVVDLEEMPPMMRVGANVSDRPYPKAQERIRKDADKAGLSAMKILGRLTFVELGVRDDGSPEIERTYCFRQRSHKLHQSKAARAEAGEDINPLDYRCKLQAGFGTSHLGAGACSRHGGNQLRTFLPGDGPGQNNHRNPLVKYDLLRALVGADDGHLAEGLLAELNMVDELALQRVALDERLKQIAFDEDGQPLDWVSGESVREIFDLTTEVTRTVERAKKLENSSALTRAHLLYLIAALRSLGERYVAEDRRPDYVRDLLGAFGLEVPAELDRPGADPDVEGYQIGQLVVQE